jgi:glycosyltransferase involved in cell wall biosynthesis
MDPKISIVIPTYNRASVLERTIRHLAGQEYPPDRYELILVDNSTDETPEVAERAAAQTPFPVRLFRGAARLPAMKRNLGLREATGEYVLFMNDDAWADPTLLREHARTHAAHTEPIAVLGHVDQSDEIPYNAFQEWYRPFAYQLLAGREDRPVPYFFFWTMNLSVPRREMLERNLVFHEDWAEIGHEDVELGYRWTRAGRQIIYNPRARCDHYHPHSLDSACRLQEGIGRGLRDLELLIPDPTLLERYGVFSSRNRPRAVFRGLIRQILFNGLTVPIVQDWLTRQRRNTPLTRWLYWKVMLHYTNRGYRQAPNRPIRPLVTRLPATPRTAEPAEPGTG